LRANRLKKLTLKNLPKLSKVPTKNTTRNTITRSTTSNTSQLNIKTLKLKSPRPLKPQLLPLSQFKPNLLQLQSHSSELKLKMLLNGQNGPKTSISQSMRSKPSLSMSPQPTTSTTLSLLPSKVSERSSDTTPSTPSSRRTEMRKKINLTTTTLPSA